MESAFNIAWVILAVLGMVVAVHVRRRTMPGKKNLARDLVIFAVLAFVLFPLVSISDDIGYFNFFFARSHPSDGVFWVSSSRREKHLYVGAMLRVVTLHLLSLGREGMAPRWSALERSSSSEAPRIATRSITPTQLRGPPSILL